MNTRKGIKEKIIKTTEKRNMEKGLPPTLSTPLVYIVMWRLWVKDHTKAGVRFSYNYTT